MQVDKPDKGTLMYEIVISGKKNLWNRDILGPDVSCLIIFKYEIAHKIYIKKCEGL
jgi:hypothetical protein